MLNYDEIDVEMNVINEDFENTLEGLFENSYIKIQYDLSCSQGSGANTYGEIEFIDVLNVYDNFKDITEEYNFKNLYNYLSEKPLNDKEVTRLKELYKLLWTTEIILSENDRYTYSKACEIEFYEFNKNEFEEQLEEGEISETDVKLIIKFNDFLINFFENLNSDIYTNMETVYNSFLEEC